MASLLPGYPSLQEPLLVGAECALPHRISRRVSWDAEEPTTRTRLLEHVRTGDHHHHEEEEEHDDEDREIQVSRFSKVCSAAARPTLRKILVAKLLGATTGIVVPMFLISSGGALSPAFSHQRHGLPHNWLVRGALIRIIGGTLVGALLWSSNAVNLALQSRNLWRSGTCLDDNIARSPQSWRQSLAVVSSSIVSSAVIGAPLGPEVGVWLLSETLASMAMHLEAFIASIRRRSTAGSQCWEASMWSNVAIAAAIGGIGLPTPAAVVLGPLLMQEIASQHRTDGNRPCTDSKSLHSLLLLLSTVASLAASVSSQWFMNTIRMTDMRYAFWSPNETGVSEADGSVPEFVAWHFELAAAIGILGGALGCGTCWAISLVERAKRASCFVWESDSPRAAAVMGSTMMAGAAVSLIVLASPVESHGLLPLWYHKIWPLVQEDGISQLQTDIDLSNVQWLYLALTIWTGMVMSLGLGLVGGSILPMTVIGFCIGKGLGGAKSWLLVHVTVPCSVAVGAVTMSDTPLTVVATLVLVGQCSLQTAGLVMVAGVVAYSVTIALKGAVNPTPSDRNGSNDVGQTDVSTDLDDELLFDVRSAIFGIA
jgi:hypothetical protein